MQYFRITGVDDCDYPIDDKYVIEPEYSYADNLHFAVCKAHYNSYLCWADFAEGIPEKTFNDLIKEGTKTVEIHGWAGRFKVELFDDEHDEYFSNLFKEHPQPWKWENDIGRCENGGSIAGILDAKGNCILSTYMNYEATSILWKLYQYYVSKEGKT